MQYTPPQLTATDDTIALRKAQELFRKFGLRNTVLIIVRLIIENRKLFLEVNEHRAARGIEPLQEHENWQ